MPETPPSLSRGSRAAALLAIYGPFVESTAVSFETSFLRSRNSPLE